MENLRGTGVVAVERSQNSKTGPVSATYVAQQSCPNTCPFLNGGCYAEHGPCGIITRRLNQVEADPITLAWIESAAIGGLSGTRPLRVHVVGDCASDPAAWIVSAAMLRHDAPAWTYTHAWRTVQRKSWGKASVLASVETPEGIREANARGYAACIVVEEHSSHKVYDLDGQKILPCRAEFSDVQCNRCLVCADDMRLLAHGLTIGVAVHGTGQKKAVAALGRA